MAERRGGFRPTAPQNNPNIVNANGGNGQSGRNTGSFQGPKQMTGGSYGEATQLREMQQGALMAGERATMAPIVPITAPTQRPEEPDTAGMPFGAGPGPEALGLLPNRADKFNEDSMVAKYIPMLEKMASEDDAPESFRLFVQQVRGRLG
jgi:hypothetical protein